MTHRLSTTWKILSDPTRVGREQRWFDAIPQNVRDVPVPGVLQQAYPEYHGVVWYWDEFVVPANIEAQTRTILEFGNVEYYAEVWVNGEFVGAHEGGDMPFRFDITSCIVAERKNLVAVRVLNPTDDESEGDMQLRLIPHRNKTDGYTSGAGINYGGIVGAVVLHCVPTVYVRDVFAKPDCHTGCICVEVTVENASPRTMQGTLSLSVSESQGGGIIDTADASGQYTSGQSVHTLTLKVSQPKLWDLDSPNLYTIEATVAAEGHEHRYSVRCGFREFIVKHGYFRLNGRRVFVRSTHTGSHSPISEIVPLTPDLMRRDLLMLKASGYNMVRYIAGVALPEQLDFCDEIGLMVYEESQAAWMLADSPKMAERFDRAVSEVILRDRNHPSLTIWGLLNETLDVPVFRRAVESLSRVRKLDPTRLVLLGSGRHDHCIQIGSLSNPGSMTWEYQWGSESPNATIPDRKNMMAAPGFFDGMGDLHLYPSTPHTHEIYEFFRKIGRGGNPVFLSEYGIGTLFNAIDETHGYEQVGASDELGDFKYIRSMAEKYIADWRRFGMADVYPSPRHMLDDSARLNARQRLLGFDLVRANPRICGFNLTGMLDHGYTGEGLWTLWRKWKPGALDALCDGWSPLRWCLFVEPGHGYSGRPFHLRAVLANEDMLKPGIYPISLKVFGPSGTIWSKDIDLVVPSVDANGDGPLAIDVFEDDAMLTGPAGNYEFVATMNKGGAPAGGRVKFHIAEAASLSAVDDPIQLWGVSDTVRKWLMKQGVRCEIFDRSAQSTRNASSTILVGDTNGVGDDDAGWEALNACLKAGASVVFASRTVLQKQSLVATVGRAERCGQYRTSDRTFDVPNADRADWLMYTKEFYGPIEYAIRDLPEGEYVVELAMCEGSSHEAASRMFNVEINGDEVLHDYDIMADAGGFHHAACRRFTVRAVNGRIDVKLKAGRTNVPSVSRIRIFDKHNTMIVEDSAQRYIDYETVRLPLTKKSPSVDFNDWLYHKECVAKRHPIFAGLQPQGIMDWDYYGPVISNRFFRDIADSDDVVVAAFAVGYCCPGGYDSGIQLASYPCGQGRFILNVLNILDNVGVHPAADRLLLNMLRYAASLRKK